MTSRLSLYDVKRSDVKLKIVCTVHLFVLKPFACLSTGCGFLGTDQFVYILNAQLFFQAWEEVILV